MVFLKKLFLFIPKLLLLLFNHLIWVKRDYNFIKQLNSEFSMALMQITDLCMHVSIEIYAYTHICAFVCVYYRMPGWGLSCVSFQPFWTWNHMKHLNSSAKQIVSSKFENNSNSEWLYFNFEILSNYLEQILLTETGHFMKFYVA